MASNITKRREPDIMHLLIEEYNAIYFYQKLNLNIIKLLDVMHEKYRRQMKAWEYNYQKICNFLKYEENI